MSKLILASKSPYRKELLNKLNIPFECIDPKFNEIPLKNIYINPKVLTQKLAIGKAKAVTEFIQDAVIIGSDQVCSINGKILGKTGCLKKSFEQLKMMQGKTHQLITSYCILAGDQEIVRTNITELEMRQLSDEQIKKYLSIDNPIDCAGSYKLELNGIGLMKNIKTEDHTAIIGIPLMQLGNDLEGVGFRLFV